MDALPGIRRQVASGYALGAGPGHSVVFPEANEDVFSLAGPLSLALAAPVLYSYVHDSDVLCLGVHEGGVRLHSYDSWPGYGTDGGGEEPSDCLDDAEEFSWPEPEGADPEAFMRFAVGPVDRLALQSALKGVPLDPEDGEGGRYVFAEAQHHDAMTALGLPAAVLTSGYDYLRWDDLPEGVTVEDIVLLGDAQPPETTRVLPAQ